MKQEIANFIGHLQVLKAEQVRRLKASPPGGFTPKQLLNERSYSCGVADGYTYAILRLTEILLEGDVDYEVVDDADLEDDAIDTETLDELLAEAEADAQMTTSPSEFVD